MSDQIANYRTTLAAEEVVVKAVQFFSTEKWRATSQSARAATFAGIPPIPWRLLALSFIGYALCVIPGIIIHFMLIKKARQFQNLVVTATPVSEGTEVVVTSPSWTSDLVSRFLQSLPSLETPLLGQ
jgi:hypothetical protein